MELVKGSMEKEQTLYMKGGIGEQSYAQNSTSQAAYLSKSKPVLWKALEDLTICSNLPETVITIADLGCSSGQNTLLAVSEITSIIYKRWGQSVSFEFRVYLNDLPGNDFNTVFKSLPAFQEKMQEENGPEFGPLFISAVPGSFYKRLFPSRSLHFVHSSSSLHWLSQVPSELSDKANPLVNKGKIYISKTSPEAVINAYKTQFQKDFSSFLQSRSEEVVPGGRMVLTFRARRTADPAPDESCLLWDYLGHAFQDLVAEGLIEEEKLDTYNTPYYEPYTEEIKVEIEKQGSFTLDQLVITPIPWELGGIERRTTAQIMAKAIRAVNESMIQTHFGSQIMDSLFQRFSEITAADTNQVDHVSVVVSLIRNN